MAEPRAAFLDRRRQELFQQLRVSYDELTDVQDIHNSTPYNCQRHGACCQVGLQLHLIECEHIANNIKAMCAGDKELLESWVSRLEHALTDKGWTWAESVGDHMCAFFEDGCSIYPFRPGICRAYGVVVGVDEWCPRKKLDDNTPFTFAQKETDGMMARLYRAMDQYGRLWPKRDYTMYMPAGVLTFLLPEARIKKIKARTEPKFWRRQKGYRMQFEPSYRTKPSLRTNVRFPSLDKHLVKVK